MVAGGHFEDLVRARLFAPMKMRRTEYEGDHGFGKSGVIWSHYPDGRLADLAADPPRPVP